MFLYIDESGNSGNNLFDPSQPVLSYGILSSRWNIDAHGIDAQKRILAKVGADNLHANKLGEARIHGISRELLELHDQFELNFDCYFIHKRSFAITTFFNAVFDQGINPTMKWHWYWTPLRFPLIGALDRVLDEDLLKESWRLCLVPNNKLDREHERISKFLTAVLQRVESSDIPTRLREILVDALAYGIQNPLEMDFGIYSQTALSPNTIGFQFVLTAIAYRKKVHRQKALGITVDRQTQFNGAQVKTYEVQSKMAAALRGTGIDRERYLAHPFMADVREDTETLIAHFPEERLTIQESSRSFGLQLTDIYLWLFNRYAKGQGIPRGVEPIVGSILSTGMIDGISLTAMRDRWRNFEQQMPAYEELTTEQLAAAQKSIDTHRNHVKSINRKKP